MGRWLSRGAAPTLRAKSARQNATIFGTRLVGGGWAANRKSVAARVLSARRWRWCTHRSCFVGGVCLCGSRVSREPNMNERSQHQQSNAKAYEWP